MGTTEPQGHTDTGLTEIAWLSSRDKAQVFHSLMHHINVESLRSCFESLDGKKALGVDGVSKAEYGAALESNLELLIARMKRMAYRPGPARQVLIPKEGRAGEMRPLGISNLEDKLVQKRMQEILESIYEPIFLDCSYGFRRGRSCHDAVKDLMCHLYGEEVEEVIDVDLANFFGSIDHQVLQELLTKKIKDRKFMRYILRMLKSGILSQGELIVSEEGTAQGASCSPVLANIVAHYVIDEWMEETVKPLMRGAVQLYRYCDDLVICCRYAKDAARVRKVLGKRLAKYKLALNEDKTKSIRFSKREYRLGVKQGTFDYLGFTFYLSKSLRGIIIPKVKTSRKRICTKLRRVKEWIKQVRNRAPLREIWKTFCTKLRGHVQYYGVSFNSKAVEIFIRKAERIVFKWLNRCSQRKSFSWDKFRLFTEKFPLPKAKVCHPLF